MEQPSTDERLHAIAMNLEILTHDVTRLRGIMDDVVLSISRLANVANAHEQRLSKLEDERG